MAEKERKKKSFRWVSTRPGKEKAKKIAKQFKKIKTTILATFPAKISWERPRKRQNKKNRSDEFVPDP